MSISDFDSEIASLDTWTKMVKWIKVDPSYRVTYLLVTENHVFMTNRLSDELIPLPESERDRDLSYVSVKSCKVSVVEGVRTWNISCEFVHKSTIKPDNAVAYDDVYIKASEVPVREILRIRSKLYDRLTHEKASEEIKKDQRAMKQMACNFLYAHYISDATTMEHLLKSESRMQSLMACPGDYKHIVFRDYCVKDLDVSKYVLHFMEVVSIDDKVRPSISRLIANDQGLLHECMFRDVCNVMKHLSFAIGEGTTVSSLDADDINAIKAEYKKGDAGLVARSSHLFRHIARTDQAFVEEMKTVLTQ